MAGVDVLDRLGTQTVPHGPPNSALVTPPTRDTNEPYGEYYDTRYRVQQIFPDLTPAYLSTGSDLPQIHLPFTARGLIMDNLSGILFKVTGNNGYRFYVPASILSHTRVLATPSDTITITIVSGALPSNAPVVFTFTEAPVIPMFGG